MNASRVEAVIARHLDDGSAMSLAWGVRHRGEVVTGGSVETIYRIASMSKPITAVAALSLVEDCVLRLDDPVDDLLPELADRQVLRDPLGPIDDTVPAARPITLRDLLTFRAGYGTDFANWGRQTAMNRAGELGIGMGPPAPQSGPAADQWLKLLGTLPLDNQPGERWLYHTAADVLGVLLSRATGQSLEDLLRALVFEPLGMRDTSFWVPPAKAERFGPCFADVDTLYDPADGQWTKPPVFASAGGGLVSTVGDFLAFAGALLDGGAPAVARASVAAMTTDQLGPDDAADIDGAVGWGFGVGVQRAPTALGPAASAYGWNGGLGSTWTNDPSEDLAYVLLTDRMFTGPTMPLVHQDFRTAVYASL